MPDPLDQFPDELKAALTIRMVEQRLLKLFSEGKLFGTVHTCIGQEFVGVAVARCLTDADTLFSNHRGHGHFLAYRRNIAGLIGEIMGKSSGVCAGRGGSQHIQQDGFYSNGIQGGIAPVTAGLAFSHKLRNTGGIAVVYIGDGTLGQGALYETLNIAGRWDLPVLFVNENNLFAQSTSQTQTLAGDINARAEAFGIKTWHSDTWEWPTLFENMKACIDEMRRTGRPAWHRVDTFRLMAHSKGDDNRAEEYVQPFRERDPINVLMSRLEHDPRWIALQAEIAAEIESAVAAADAAPWGDVRMDEHKPGAEREYHWQHRTFDKEKGVAAVRRGLEHGLENHPNLVLIGEDIESPYGGAFKATMGLSARWPERVRNTPISEHAISGIGNGLALGGMLPVVEIMFGDFMTLCTDQWINHAAKFRFMYNDKVRVPLVLRTPMGGKRGYAATHSQSLEKHFVGLPDTQVLCLSHRYSPALLYKDLFASIDRPTLVIENKLLYGQNVSSEPPPGFDLIFTNERFPTAWLRPDTGPAGSAADLTIIALGGVALDAEEAALRLFNDEDLICDVFIPSRLFPFDIGVVEPSLRASRRLLVVEEGQAFGGLAGEIIAQACERYGHPGLCARRVCATPNPIPAARPLEQHCLPGANHIVTKALEVVRESARLHR